MRREVSAGVVVYKVDEKTHKRKYLLLLYPKGHWDLPKGKVEPGETYLQTALREVKEETNLEVEIHPGFEESLNYQFRGYKGELISKTVVYFVGKALHANVILSEEHLDSTSLEFEEAHKTLSFQNSKDVLVKAEKFLENLK